MAKPIRTRSRPQVRDDFAEAVNVSEDMPSDIDPIKLSTPYLITLVARLQTSVFETRALESGISLAATYLLHELGLGAAFSHSELSKRLSIGHATVAQTVKRLERDGLVERSLYEPDKRQVRVRLTPKGKAVREPLQVASRALIAEVSGILGPETEAVLQDALTRLAGHFREVR